MKLTTKVLLTSFASATVATGITAGVAIPVLSDQSRAIQTQNSTQNNPEVTDNSTSGTTGKNPEVTNNENTGSEQNNSPTLSEINPSNNGDQSTISEPAPSLPTVEEGDETNSNPTNDSEQTPGVSVENQYKELFETANSNGTVKKFDDKNPSYIDPSDLSKDAENANYFGNFYDPIIPNQLTANGVVVTPENFEVKNGDVIFYYNLKSSTVSVVAKAVVHGFYKYPAVADNQTVDTKWKPQNFDFLRSNLVRWPDQQVFDQFILNHWNDSLLNDAINAYRYYFLLYTNNTTFLKKYINAGFYNKNGTDRRANWTIGYLIGSSFAVTNDPNLAGALQNVPDWHIPNGANGVKINPTYVTSSDLKAKDNAGMSLKWELRNFVQKNYKDSVSGNRGPSAPFTVTGELKFSIPKAKPTMQEIPTLPKAPKVKLAKQKITVTATVTNPNPSDRDAQKTAKVTKTYDFSILDALYRYVVILDGSTAPNQYPTPYFNLFDGLLNQNV